MTEVILLMGTPVWTKLSKGEMHSLLQGGNKSGSFMAYLDEAGTQLVEVSVDDISYIKHF